MFDVRKTRTHAFWLCVMGLLVVGATSSPSLLVAQRAAITDQDVLPVVEKCFRCHGDNLQMSNLDLRSRDSMLRGGKNGPAIVPGRADDSLLMKRITGEIKPQMPMPPLAALTADEVAIIKQWIDQGAQGSGIANTSAAATPAAAA